jgi:hypothetical protein
MLISVLALGSTGMIQNVSPLIETSPIITFFEVVNKKSLFTPSRVP